MRIHRAKSAFSYIFVLVAVVAFAATASADTIDLSAFTGPSTFAAAGPTQSVTIATSIGNVVFSGGVVLTAATNLAADQNSVYGTENSFLGGDPSLLSAITVTFPVDVTSFFLNLYNGLPQTEQYTVSDNVGASVVVDVPSNLSSGSSLVDLTTAGNVVTITDTGLFASQWDFFIDSIGFDQAPVGTPITPVSVTLPPTNPPPTPGTPVPEPPLVVLLASAAMAVGLWKGYSRFSLGKAKGCRI